MLTHAADVTCLSYHNEFLFALRACLLMSPCCLNTLLEFINPEHFPCTALKSFFKHLDV